MKVTRLAAAFLGATEVAIPAACVFSRMKFAAVVGSYWTVFDSTIERGKGPWFLESAKLSSGTVCVGGAGEGRWRGCSSI